MNVSQLKNEFWLFISDLVHQNEIGAYYQVEQKKEISFHDSKEVLQTKSFDDLRTILYINMAVGYKEFNFYLTNKGLPYCYSGYLKNYVKSTENYQGTVKGKKINENTMRCYILDVTDIFGVGLADYTQSCKKYEYSISKFYPFPMTDKELNFLGSEGWELCAILPIQETSRILETYLYHFKRQITKS